MSRTTRPKIVRRRAASTEAAGRTAAGATGPRPLQSGTAFVWAFGAATGAAALFHG